MAPVFSSGRSFTTQLCLWAPPLPLNLTQSWCANSGMVRTLIISSITGKGVLTITPLKWLFAMHIIFDRNTGRKRSKIRWLFESNLRYPSYFKLYRPWLLSTKLWISTTKTAQFLKMSGCFTPRCSSKCPN